MAAKTLGSVHLSECPERRDLLPLVDDDGHAAEDGESERACDTLRSQMDLESRSYGVNPAPTPYRGETAGSRRDIGGKPNQARPPEPSGSDRRPGGNHGAEDDCPDHMTATLTCPVQPPPNTTT